MSEIATELELKWIDHGDWLQSTDQQWAIHWWEAKYGIVSLFKTQHGEMFWEMDGRLHEAVKHVMERSK